MKRCLFSFSLLLTVAMLSANAADKATFDFSRSGTRKLGKSAQVAWAKKVQQGFNMKVWLSNQIAMGIEAWDPSNVPKDDCADPGIGMQYPVGSCVEHLFGAAPF